MWSIPYLTILCWIYTLLKNLGFPSTMWEGCGVKRWWSWIQWIGRCLIRKGKKGKLWWWRDGGVWNVLSFEKPFFVINHWWKMWSYMQFTSLSLLSSCSIPLNLVSCFVSAQFCLYRSRWVCYPPWTSWTELVPQVKLAFDEESSDFRLSQRSNNWLIW